MRKLFDLAAADENIRFSPYFWRVKLASAHKNLDVKFLPWHFTEREKISFSGQNKVPILIDGEKNIFDSWEIAKYLEKEYPDSPSLKISNGEVLLIKFWTEKILHRELLKFIVLDIYHSLTTKDQKYFRESREKNLFP